MGTIDEDIREFVKPALVCNQPKPSYQALVSCLRPLPVPHWSHISLDFVSDLPPSSGNTIILTVANRFSKIALFIPLSKLPSAKEMAVLLILHIVRLHSIPADVVSD